MRAVYPIRWCLLRWARCRARRFVSEPLQEFAYEDSALPIEAGQTISQPYIVARMIELLELARS